MAKVLLVAVVRYFGAYAVLRQTQQEVWAQDSRTYVIVPADWPVLHYLFRPAMQVDARLTDMQFHIGPHQ